LKYQHYFLPIRKIIFYFSKKVENFMQKIVFFSGNGILNLEFFF